MRRTSPRFISRHEQVESRLLCTASTVAPLRTESLGTLVQALGTVSAEGVRATGWVEPAGGIGFHLVLEVSGDYVLWFRHAGGEVVLKAETPEGLATLHPGPAGPFESFALPLKAGEYLITAEAVGNQVAFIDWNLLLANGMGQAPAGLSRFELAAKATQNLAAAPAPAIAPRVQAPTATTTESAALVSQALSGSAAPGGLSLVPKTGLIGRPRTDTFGPADDPAPPVPDEFRGRTDALSALERNVLATSVEQANAGVRRAATADEAARVSTAQIIRLGELRSQWIPGRGPPLEPAVGDAPTAAEGLAVASPEAGDAHPRDESSALSKAEVDVWIVPLAVAAVVYRRIRSLPHFGKAALSRVPKADLSYHPSQLPCRLRGSMKPTGAVAKSHLLPRWPHSGKPMFSRLRKLAELAEPCLED